MAERKAIPNMLCSHTQHYIHIQISSTQKNYKICLHYKQCEMRSKRYSLVQNMKILRCIGDTSFFPGEAIFRISDTAYWFSCYVASVDRFYKRVKNNSWVIPARRLQAGVYFFIWGRYISKVKRHNGLVNYTTWEMGPGVV